MLTNDMDGGQDRTARDWQGVGGGHIPVAQGSGRVTLRR